MACSSPYFCVAPRNEGRPAKHRSDPSRAFDDHDDHEIRTRGSVHTALSDRTPESKEPVGGGNFGQPVGNQWQEAQRRLRSIQTSVSEKRLKCLINEKGREA